MKNTILLTEKQVKLLSSKLLNEGLYFEDDVETANTATTSSQTVLPNTQTASTSQTVQTNSAEADTDGVGLKLLKTTFDQILQKRKNVINDYGGRDAYDKAAGKENGTNKNTTYDIKVEEKDGKVGNSVVYCPLSRHITRMDRQIKYLAIHYTAGGTSKTGTARSLQGYFNNGRPASADFAVDDGEMVQLNPNPRKYVCWAVGDKGDGRKKSIFNKDCISIEMCSNLKKGANHHEPNHPGWYFTEDTLNNGRRLAKILMATYKIPQNNVIRHFDVSGKMCPGIPGWNTGELKDMKGRKTGIQNNEAQWDAFKKSL